MNILKRLKQFVRKHSPFPSTTEPTRFRFNGKYLDVGREIDLGEPGGCWGCKRECAFHGGMPIKAEGEKFAIFTRVETRSKIKLVQWLKNKLRGRWL